MKEIQNITPQRVKLAIQNRFNPIQNFTPDKLAQQIDQFHAGYLTAAARTWDAMEKRDIVLGNVAAKRKKAVARLPWEISVVDESADAKKQKKVLEEFYKQIRVTSVLDQNERGGIALLVRQMMDAVGKRYAVHEIVWNARDEDGRDCSAEFRFCPLWWFENLTGRLRFLQQDFQVEGVPMKEAEWMVTVGEGIMESCSVSYVFKHLPLKDWLAFSEKFGMPGVLGKTNAAKDSAEWEAMEEAVAAFGQDWAAVCSANDILELVEVKSGGNNLPYPPLVEYCDRAMAARWRGADLSTISQGKEGVGASLQGDETNLLLEDDARLVTETLNDQVDRHVLEQAFGENVEVKARFRLLASTSSEADEAFRRAVYLAFLNDGTVGDVMANLMDLKKLTDIVGLPANAEYVEPYLPVTAEAGPAVTGGVIEDDEGDIVGGEVDPDRFRSAFEEVMPMPTVQTEGKPSALPNTALINARSTPARRAFAAATKEAFKPIAERLQKIYALTDITQQRVELRTLLHEFPQLEKLINSLPDGPKNTDAIQRAIEAGMKKGIKERKRTTNN
jgi:hypothetical protein